jgi:hypothetical protein
MLALMQEFLFPNGIIQIQHECLLARGIPLKTVKLGFRTKNGSCR